MTDIFRAVWSMLMLSALAPGATHSSADSNSTNYRDKSASRQRLRMPQSVPAPDPASAQYPAAGGFVENARLPRRHALLGREKFHLRFGLREGA